MSEPPPPPFSISVFAIRRSIEFLAILGGLDVVSNWWPPLGRLKSAVDGSNWAFPAIVVIAVAAAALSEIYTRGRRARLEARRSRPVAHKRRRTR